MRRLRTVIPRKAHPKGHPSRTLGHGVQLENSARSSAASVFGVPFTPVLSISSIPLGGAFSRPRSNSNSSSSSSSSSDSSSSDDSSHSSSSNSSRNLARRHHSTKTSVHAQAVEEEGGDGREGGKNIEKGRPGTRSGVRPKGKCMHTLEDWRVFETRRLRQPVVREEECKEGRWHSVYPGGMEGESSFALCNIWVGIFSRWCDEARADYQKVEKCMGRKRCLSAKPVHSTLSPRPLPPSPSLPLQEPRSGPPAETMAVAGTSSTRRPAPRDSSGIVPRPPSIGPLLPPRPPPPKLPDGVRSSSGSRWTRNRWDGSSWSSLMTSCPWRRRISVSCARGRGGREGGREGRRGLVTPVPGSIGS